MWKGGRLKKLMSHWKIPRPTKTNVFRGKKAAAGVLLIQIFISKHQTKPNSFEKKA